MKSNSELAMAVDTKLNSILSEIQQSNLNFMINLTPYAAYVTIKKSTQVDKNGLSMLPSPPVLRLLDECLREKLNAENEIKQLKDLLSKSEEHCQDLARENGDLMEKLISTNDTLKITQVLNGDLKKKIGAKCIKVETVELEKEKIKHEASAIEKKNIVSEYTIESNNQLATMKKSLKNYEKEVHNLNRKLNNVQDTNTIIKADLKDAKQSVSTMQSKLRKSEESLLKANRRKQTYSVEIQTSPTLDTPYLITDPLPPIFGSQLCRKSKSVFLRKSLPNLSFLSWVSISEEDIIRDQAEEALNYLYDLEVENFYKEARDKADRNRSSPDSQIDRVE